MNITNATQTSGFPPISQSTQDTHEQKIQNQILNLQEKMRDVTYNREMSSEEKDSRKKELQEQIQNLNSELKQYQLRKRQEEAEKRQEEAARRQKEEAGNSTETVSAFMEETADTEDAEDFPESNASKAIFSNSNRKDHLSSLHKVRNDLEGKLRTATTEEEKAKLRKRLRNVSKAMGVKINDLTDTIADSQKEGPSDKAKTGRSTKEPGNDSSMPGKVIITRIKN